jgi:hypothetical protein
LITFSKESTSAVVLKFKDLFSAKESKLALEGVGGLVMAAILLLKIETENNSPNQKDLFNFSRLRAWTVSLQKICKFKGAGNLALLHSL